MLSFYKTKNPCVKGNFVVLKALVGFGCIKGLFLGASDIPLSKLYKRLTFIICRTVVI